jgi:hypothetical protein
MLSQPPGPSEAEILGNLKQSFTSSSLEPATFRLLARRLNNYATTWASAEKQTERFARPVTDVKVTLFRVIKPVRVAACNIDLGTSRREMSSLCLGHVSAGPNGWEAARSQRSVWILRRRQIV